VCVGEREEEGAEEMEENEENKAEKLDLKGA
jgi:hypothetical protein